MIAAASGEVDLARLLLDLLIVLAAAKLAAELAELLRIPAVLGEIAAGILVGPSVAGLVQLDGARGVSITVLAEIGVLLLLVQVGMEMDLAEFGRVGRSALLVGVVGVVAPFAGGFGVARVAGLDGDIALFLGAALTATSVGITARVLGDLRALATVEARIVLGAAVADDVLGLVILTVVVKVVTGGSVGVATVASTFGVALLFLLVAGTVAVVVVPRVVDAIARRSASPATVSVAALVIVLGFAEVADAARLAFIIGAFIAGIGLGRSRQHERIGRDLGALGVVLVPVFFAQIGINADLGVMFSPKVLALAAGLIAVAVVGKLLSATGVIGTPADRLLVGIGMIPRGEVGLIFAAIGLSSGALGTDEYGALLLMVLVTTVMTPPLLRWRLGRVRPAEERPTTEEPDSGWLTVEDGQIHLCGRPPVTETLPIALGAAALAESARPSAELLDWIGEHRRAPLEWAMTATDALVEVLGTGSNRPWQLLETTGVLERALPDVARAMARRRADIGDLDPVSALSLPVLERLHAMNADLGDTDRRLLLAALCADVCADETDGCTRRLAARLVTTDEAGAIVRLVDDAHLLRDDTHDLTMFDGSHLDRLTAHLADAGHARRAYRLALALDPLPDRHRHALAEQMQLVESRLLG